MTRNDPTAQIRLLGQQLRARYTEWCTQADTADMVRGLTAAVRSSSLLALDRDVTAFSAIVDEFAALRDGLQRSALMDVSTDSSTDSSSAPGLRQSVPRTLPDGAPLPAPAHAANAADRAAPRTPDSPLREVTQPSPPHAHFGSHDAHERSPGGSMRDLRELATLLGQSASAASMDSGARPLRPTAIRAPANAPAMAPAWAPTTTLRPSQPTARAVDSHQPVHPREYSHRDDSRPPSSNPCEVPHDQDTDIEERRVESGGSRPPVSDGESSGLFESDGAATTEAPDLKHQLAPRSHRAKSKSAHHPTATHTTEPVLQPSTARAFSSHSSEFQREPAIARSSHREHGEPSTEDLAAPHAGRRNDRDYYDELLQRLEEEYRRFYG